MRENHSRPAGELESREGSFTYGTGRARKSQGIDRKTDRTPQSRREGSPRRRERCGYGMLVGGDRRRTRANTRLGGGSLRRTCRRHHLLSPAWLVELPDG